MRTKALVTAMEDKFSKELGEDMKPLFAKIEKMIKQKRKHAEIEKMMTEEIIKCMGNKMKQLRFLPT